MMRSLYAGTSGLKNHQTKMDVVGNNIANVNTTGFKRSRTNFQDLLSQNLKGAASPQGSRGGINGQQVGLGVGMASINMIVTQGNTQYTGKTLDMAIEGAGYFILQNGANQFYTRAGTFDLDCKGNLVSTNNGFKVSGWLADANGILPNRDVNTMTSINIPTSSSIGAQATTKINYEKNLKSGLTTKEIDFSASVTPSSAHNERVVKNIDVFNEKGIRVPLEIIFEKGAVGDPWRVSVNPSASLKEDIQGELLHSLTTVTLADGTKINFKPPVKNTTREVSLYPTLLNPYNGMLDNKKVIEQPFTVFSKSGKKIDLTAKYTTTGVPGAGWKMTVIDPNGDLQEPIVDRPVTNETFSLKINDGTVVSIQQNPTPIRVPDISVVKC